MYEIDLILIYQIRSYYQCIVAPMEEGRDWRNYNFISKFCNSLNGLLYKIVLTFLLQMYKGVIRQAKRNGLF